MSRRPLAATLPVAAFARMRVDTMPRILANAATDYSRCCSNGERMASTILAYDLGTGGSKASLYDVDGTCLASTFVHYETFYPQTGWHEQRPEDWWNAVVECTRRLLAENLAQPGDIACLAISGHSLGVVPIDGNGELLREKTPIWSDTRSARQTAAFFRTIDKDIWYMATGNGFPAECYPVFKIMWYRDNEPSMLARAQGDRDEGLHQHEADREGPHRPFLRFRVRHLRPGTLVLLGRVPSRQRPVGRYLPRDRAFHSCRRHADARGCPDAGAYHECEGCLRRRGQFLHGAGARNIKDGRVYTSLGSSAWIAVSSKKPVLDAKAKPFVFAHVVPELFTSAVSIFAAGSSFKWLRDTICHGSYEIMNEMAARSPVGANKLIFNPSLAGGTSQEASPHIRGCFAGLDLRHTPDDLVRAALEGIAMNLGAVLEVLRRFVPLGGEMLMVGGGSKSRLWRQIFADVYDMDIVKTNIDQEAGSLGAAAVAAVGARPVAEFCQDRRDSQDRSDRESDAAQHRHLPKAAASVRLRPAVPGDAGRHAARD